jgi:hypothetical protein
MVLFGITNDNGQQHPEATSWNLRKVGDGRSTDLESNRNKVPSTFSPTRKPAEASVVTWP